MKQVFFGLAIAALAIGWCGAPVGAQRAAAGSYINPATGGSRERAVKAENDRYADVVYDLPDRKGYILAEYDKQISRAHGNYDMGVFTLGWLGV